MVTVGLTFRSDLDAVMGSIYSTIFSEDGEQPCLSLHQETMVAFLNVAILSKEVEGTETSMSLVDFKNWCRVLPSVRKFLGSLLMPLDSGSPALYGLYALSFIYLLPFAVQCYSTWYHGLNFIHLRLHCLSSIF